MKILSLATDTIKLDFAEHLLWITLNRPESSNAYSESMITDFVSVLRTCASESDIRCVIITGAGKHFCAGGDVKSMLEKSGMFAGEANELRQRYELGIQQITRALEALDLPVIAMINGAAIGAGLDLACMCDIRLCSSTAVFAESFSKLGLVPGDGGAFVLQRVVGYAKAMEMSLTADTYSSDQALQMGLVSRVCAPEQLRDEVLKVAQKIASNAPIAVKLTKKALRQSYRHDLNQALELAAAYQGICQRTDDHFLALNAIKNKTHPTFQGS